MFNRRWERAMLFDNTKSDDRLEQGPESGDHLEQGPDQRQAVVANIPERQGVTGQGVRYVLMFGIVTVVAAFAIMLISFLS
jgi:hypothetical protein